MKNVSLAVGDNAPTFMLPDQDGNSVSLSDYSGRWLVLYFYPKDNTPGCTLEGHDFSLLLEEFRALGADVVGVSKDSVASHCRFRDKKSLSVTLLSDEKLEMQQQYGVWKEKKLYGKTFLGTVRTTFLIDPQGKIALHWDKVKAKGHAAEVLAILKDVVS